MANRLAAIQIGKKALGMCDDSYRILLNDMFGKQSAKDLTETEKGELLDRFQKLGFKPTKKKAHPGKPHNFATMPEMITKIEALLADMQLSWAYAESIAKRQTGIDKMAWVRDEKSLRAVIAALAVEQEKRALLGGLTHLLEQRGMTIEQFEKENSSKLKKGWQRNRRTLKALHSHFLFNQG
jgi:phage gp16-like protein